MKRAPLPFNRVIVRTAHGDQHLTASEFMQIPLTERVRALLEKRVEFFQNEQGVEQLAALKALRQR